MLVRNRVHPPSARMRSLLPLALILFSLLSIPSSLTARVLAENSPLSGHAEVVAQGTVELSSDQVVWQTRVEAIEAAADPRTLAGPGFAVATTGSLLVRSYEGRDARLAAGESAFLPADVVSTAINLSSDSSSLTLIQLSTSGSSKPEDVTEQLFESDPFIPPSGALDLNLVRDVLIPKEHSDISGGALPALIYSQSGEITVKNANGGTIELGPNEYGTLTESLTVTATGDSDAVFYVALLSSSTEIPDVGIATPEVAGTPVAIDGGTIRVVTYLCPAGVTIEDATPATCGKNGAYGSGGFALSGGNLDDLISPVLDNDLWTWTGLQPGDYVISIAEYPDGYTYYAIDLDPAAQHIDADLVVTIAETDSIVSVNLYFIDPPETATE